MWHKYKVIENSYFAQGQKKQSITPLASELIPRLMGAGTKVKNIRLTNGDHNIDCKIEGFGAMALKSEFVKKA
jgi:alkylphosphonate utilization operon protein PhnA